MKLQCRSSQLITYQVIDSIRKSDSATISSAQLNEVDNCLPRVPLNDSPNKIVSGDASLGCNG